MAHKQRSAPWTSAMAPMSILPAGWLSSRTASKTSSNAGNSLILLLDLIKTPDQERAANKNGFQCIVLLDKALLVRK